jgi:hypothetical protein
MTVKIPRLLKDPYPVYGSLKVDVVATRLHCPTITLSLPHGAGISHMTQLASLATREGSPRDWF